MVVVLWLLLGLLKFLKLVDARCYSSTDCTGDPVSISEGDSGYTCCVRTDEGQSYLLNSQCSRCIVHGFEASSYTMMEGETLNLQLYQYVKGPGMRDRLLLTTTVTAYPEGDTDLSDFEFDAERMELRITSDAISLEYDEFLTLRFTTESNLLSFDLGIFWRENITVDIIDTNKLELNLLDCEYSVKEGSNFTQPLVILISGATQNDLTIYLSSVSIDMAEKILNTSYTSIADPHRATLGTDFEDHSMNVTIPRSDYVGLREVEVHLLLVLDDDINEPDQFFAIIATLITDTPSEAACFQSEAGYSNKRASTVIKVIDNDEMIIGFKERTNRVTEDVEFLDSFPERIEVIANRKSEVEHSMTVDVVQPSTNATVSSTSQSVPNTDIVLGVGKEQISETRNLESLETTTFFIIAIHGDFVKEELECVTLSISSESMVGTPVDCNGDSLFCEHTICIEDNDKEPFEVEFVETSYTVLESVGSIEVCVNLSFPFLDVLSEFVIVSINDKPNSSLIPTNATRASPDFLGISSSDYVGQLNTLKKIMEPMRVVCYNHTIYDDLRVEAVEYVGLTLSINDSTSTTIVKPSYDEAVIVILDDDSDVLVGFEMIMQNVTEHDGVVQVCTIVNGSDLLCPVEFPFSVKFLTLNRNAINNSDYIAPSSMTLSFNKCETRQCVDIGIVSDMIDEPEESFTYSLERTPDLDPRISLDPIEGEIIITSQCPDGCGGVPIVVGFESNIYTTSESQGMVELSVVVMEPSSGAPRPFSLSLTTEEGTAVSSEDYTTLGANSTLQFVVGDTRKLLVVQIIQNTMCDQAVEDLSVHLSLYSGALPITTNQSSARIIIYDEFPTDCMLRIGLERTVIRVIEEDGIVEVCVVVTRPQNNCPIEFGFNVTITTSSGTAEETLDFFSQHSMTLSFDKCEIRQCVDIGIVSDMIDEPEESFTYSLERTPDLDTRISLDSVQGEIIITSQCPDGCNGVTIVVGFESSSYTTSESLGMVELSVFVMEPSSGAPRPFSLSLTTEEGTARNSSDYTSINGLLEFTTGDSRKTVNVEISEDLICEQTMEEFLVHLTLHSGALSIAISKQIMSVSINDYNETECSMEVKLNRTRHTVSEEEGAVSVCVFPTSPAVECPFQNPFIVNLVPLDRNTEGELDYNTPFPSFTIQSCETQCVDIGIVSDMIDEPEESFTYSFERTPDLDPRISLDPAQGEVIITSQCPDGCNGVPIVVGFESGIYTASESQGTVELSVIITEPVIGGTPRHFKLAVQTENGTAVSGEDYTQIVNSTLEFNTTVTRKSIVIHIQRNITRCRASNTHNLFLHISLLGGSLPLIVEPSTAEVVIQETNCMVGLETTIYSVPEDIGSVEVCVNVKSTDIECPIEFPFHVSISALDGSAVGSSMDYINFDELLQFDMCEIRKCLNISVVSDMIDEPEEYFILTLQERLDHDPRIKLDPAQGKVFIASQCPCNCSDRVPIVVGFELSSYTASESEGMTELLVKVMEPSIGTFRPFSLILTVIEDTAIRSDISIEGNELINFSAGEQSVFHKVLINSDLMCESNDEKLYFELKLYSGVLPITIERERAQLVITDLDCRAVVGLESTVYSVTEDVGVANVCVIVRSPDIQCPVGIPFNISFSTIYRESDLELDFVPVSKLIHFQPCQKRQCTGVMIVADMIDEPEETLHFVIKQTSGLDTRISLDQTEGDIVIQSQCADGCNGVPIVVGFESSIYTTSESQGMAELSVVVLEPSSGTPRLFSLSLTTENDTAALANDYTFEANKILEFEPGDKRKMFSIEIIQDEECEMNDEMFLVRLALKSGALPVNISEPLSHIVISDCSENECSEIMFNMACIGAVDSGSTNLLIVYIVVPIAVITLLLLTLMAVLLVVCYHFRRKKRALNTSLPTYRMQRYAHNIPAGGIFKGSMLGEIRDKVPRELLFTKDKIHLSNIVGQGESGVVYKAYMDGKNGSELVAIKTVKVLFASSDVDKLIKEINLMVTFDHPNIMVLKGVCLDQENPLLIMPFMSNGSVLEYVRHHKDDLMLKEIDHPHKVTAAQKLMIGMCLQVAKGMEYLTQERVVHRDLAARNCMIDMNGVIKVADFGLTEDVYMSNYFRTNASGSENDEKVPIRWMAPESINGELYNEKTDVWSYGVTCWEIFTCGQVPYQGIPVMRLSDLLSSGERLNKPGNFACTNEVFTIIKSCWNEVAEERPSFSDLVQLVSSLLEAEAGYLDLSTTLAWKSSDSKEEENYVTAGIENVYDTVL